MARPRGGERIHDYRLAPMTQSSHTQGDSGVGVTTSKVAMSTPSMVLAKTLHRLQFRSETFRSQALHVHVSRRASSAMIEGDQAAV